jgi:hypothetical protein
VAGKKTIFAIERYQPFILPMSGRKWKFITGGIHILAARSAFVVWNSGRPGLFLKVQGPAGVVVSMAAWMLDPVTCAG